MPSERFKVLWTAAAEGDLSRLVDFVIERDSRDRALDVCERLEKVARSLGHAPGRGRIVPEFHEHGVVVYSELIVKPWRLIYRVEHTSVLILAVIDSRRDAADLLWERLTR